MPSPIQIAFIDDHPLLREGLAQLVGREADMQVVAQGAAASDAVRIARELEPDLMLIDLNLPGDTLQALDAIAALRLRTRVAILTASTDGEALVSALRHGALGYILKGTTSRELIPILRGIAAGGSYVPPAMAAQLLSSLAGGAPTPAAPSQIDQLSEREREILYLVAEGLSNREVGQRLHLAEKTIKYYLTTIFEKLQVRSRVEAALVVSRIEASRGQPAR